MAEPKAPQPRPAAATAPRVDPAGFIAAHQAGIWRYLRLLGAPATEADDVVQDTFLTFLRRHEARADATPLLRTIARGLWIDRQRWLARRRAVERAAAVDELLAPESGRDDPTMTGWLAALASCRESLAPRTQRALDLAYRDGLGRQRIADELGVAANTVRNLLARTRQSLRECIDRKTNQEEHR
ncbi:MAG: sigma-70 family RNA polymerase sigma factor [bacterium]|nr:sigma-70 family RNA polymerase sigma factor [bacterium]